MWNFFMSSKAHVLFSIKVLHQCSLVWKDVQVNVDFFGKTSSTCQLFPQKFKFKWRVVQHNQNKLRKLLKGTVLFSVVHFDIN